MNKIILCATLAVLLLNIQYAQTVYNSTNADIITLPINSSWSHTISLRSAYAAESYIAQKLGQQYYDDYVSLYGGDSYANTSYVYFTYNVPFATGISVAEAHKLLGITVTVYDGNVIGYIGPNRPYLVSVNDTQAAVSAGASGAANVSEGLTGVFNASNLTSFSYYSVLWDVISRNLTNGTLYKSAYVDISNGNVVGEYFSNSLIIGNWTDRAYWVVRNFTGSNATAQVVSFLPSLSTPNMLYVLIAFVIAILLAALAFRLSRKN